MKSLSLLFVLVLSPSSFAATDFSKVADAARKIVFTKLGNGCEPHLVSYHKEFAGQMAQITEAESEAAEVFGDRDRGALLTVAPSQKQIAGFSGPVESVDSSLITMSVYRRIPDSEVRSFQKRMEKLRATRGGSAYPSLSLKQAIKDSVRQLYTQFAGNVDIELGNIKSSGASFTLWSSVSEDIHGRFYATVTVYLYGVEQLNNGKRAKMLKVLRRAIELSSQVLITLPASDSGIRFED